MRARHSWRGRDADLVKVAAAAAAAGNCWCWGCVFISKDAGDSASSEEAGQTLALLLWFRRQEIGIAQLVVLAHRWARQLFNPSVLVLGLKDYTS